MTESRVDPLVPTGSYNRTGPTPKAMRHALSAFATGIAFVAADVDGRPLGMLANSFTSVSLDPPIVSISFARTSTTWPLLQRVSHWGISILGHQDEGLVPLLSRPATHRFDDVEYETSVGGGVLLPGAIASFNVIKDAEINAGDHMLTLLRVLDTQRDSEKTPLVFYGSALHQLAA